MIQLTQFLKIFPTFLLCLLPFLVFGQLSKLDRDFEKLDYKLKLKFFKEKNNLSNCRLKEVRDSTLMIANLFKRGNQNSEIDISTIKSIVIVDKGRFNRRRLSFTAIGFLVGLTVGAKIKQDNAGSYVDLGTLGLIASTTAGTFTGFLLGSVFPGKAKLTIPINGSQKKYNEQKEKLKMLLY